MIDTSFALTAIILTMVAEWASNCTLDRDEGHPRLTSHFEVLTVHQPLCDNLYVIWLRIAVRRGLFSVTAVQKDS